VFRTLFTLARKAGFGVIFHCEPVRSEAEAIKTYLAKYICKHVGQRLLIDKGRRLVAYFGEGAECREIPAANRFAFGGSMVQVMNGVRRPDYRAGWAWLYRQKKAKHLARFHGITDPNADLCALLGAKWEWNHREEIQAEELYHYPYLFLAVLDRRVTMDDVEEIAGGTQDSDLIRGPLNIGRTRYLHPFAGVHLAGPGEGEATYQGKHYSSASVMANYRPAMPAPEPEDFTVIWSDGGVEHSQVSLVEA
jgi:hypothetical protein